MWWFYKTFNSDAITISQLFWLKVTLQEWVETVWFLEKSTSYFERLEDANYSYVALQMDKTWNISVLRNHKWSKSLEISIPSEIFQWLLDDLMRIHEKYSTFPRLIQPLDLPFDNNDDYESYKNNLIKDFELKDNNIKKSD